MEFQLTEGEVQVLWRVLHFYLPQLRSEIYHTENYDWRQDLKEDEETVKSLLQRLGPGGHLGEQANLIEEKQPRS